MTTLPIILDIAQSVEIVAPEACLVRGERVPLPERSVRWGRGGEVWRDALVEALGSLIYDVHYLGRPVRSDRFAPTDRQARPVEALEHPEFAMLLHGACAGSNFIDDGWRILRRAGKGSWCVTDGAIMLSATEAELVGPRIEGASVGVRLPCRLPYASPGYFVAISEHGPPRADEPSSRIYLHVTSPSAPIALRRLTRWFGEAGARASVKTINHPGEYTRPDTMVMWLERSAVAACRPVVRDLLQEDLVDLEPRVPAFVRPWFPGVGVADEPLQAAARSFGEHRCRVVARGIIAAYAGGRQLGSVSPGERFRAVVAALEEEGLDPARLYLEPGAADVYEDVLLEECA